MGASLWDASFILWINTLSPFGLLEDRDHPTRRSLGWEPFQQEDPEETATISTRSTCPSCFPSLSFQVTRSQGAVLCCHFGAYTGLTVHRAEWRGVIGRHPTGRWPSRLQPLNSAEEGDLSEKGNRRSDPGGFLLTQSKLWPFSPASPVHRRSYPQKHKSLCEVLHLEEVSYSLKSVKSRRSLWSLTLRKSGGTWATFSQINKNSPVIFSYLLSSILQLSSYQVSKVYSTIVCPTCIDGLSSTVCAYSS